MLILAAASLLTIKSADASLFTSQLVWFVLAFLLIFVLAQIDWRPILNYRWIIVGGYLLVLGLLLLTLAFAPVIRESKSWLVLGPVRFQTAELAKVGLIIILAYFFAKRHIGIARLKTLFLSFFYFAAPAALILLQPDWGSVLVLFGLWVGFLLVSGISWRHLFIGFFLTVLVAFLGWNFFLADYHKERIIGFLEPSYDPLGVNYSVIQAKIAIGSAGFLGRGFLQGTQTQLGFLTEPATDFIFAAFTEEWGFLGAALVIAALIIVVLRIVRIGLLSANNFSQFISLGTAMLLLWEFILNIGSNLGLSPVVGVTFPFLSYGGSSLLTKAVLVGIIQSIAVRNKL